MDPDLLSMIWWGVPALVGFAVMLCSAASLAWLAIRDSGSIAAWWVAVLLFVVPHAFSWTCYVKAHEFGRAWLGAEPVAEASDAEAK